MAYLTRPGNLYSHCFYFYFNQQNLRRQIRKKEYKFNIADADKNGKMNRDEYVDFEHPEENINMQEIALDEVIEDVDQNDDGYDKNTKNLFNKVSSFYDLQFQNVSRECGSLFPPTHRIQKIHSHTIIIITQST